MQFIQTSDALLCVVRAFDNPAVAWPANCETPARQLDTIRTELLLRDLAVVENRLERITETENKRDRLSDDEQKERKLLTTVREKLENEQLVNRQELSQLELKTIGTLGLFTARPIIVAVNIDEHQLSKKSYPDQDYIRGASVPRTGSCLYRAVRRGSRNPKSASSTRPTGSSS